MEIVTLKNGATEADVTVFAAMASLDSLMKKNPMALYELTQKCRDENHKVFNEHLELVLKDGCLMEQDGKIHESIKNIVLSAVVGDGLDMILDSPIK